MDRAKLDSLAASRLEHVLIALRDDDRAYNVRDVLDPWWCFERGPPFVARRRDGGYRDIQFNKPCPCDLREVLPRFDRVSTGATEIIAIGKNARILDRKQHPPEFTLIVDHSVPISVICKHLWAAPKAWTIERLRSLLYQTFRRAVLSYEENRRLDERQLKSKMPEGWRVGDDPFARYDVAGIRLIP